MPLPTIDTAYLLKILTDLLNIPSPTGLAEPALAYAEQAMIDLGLEPRRTIKGAVVCEWAGRRDSAPRALTAHADTLGAMVKEIKRTVASSSPASAALPGTRWKARAATVCTAEGRAVRGSVVVGEASDTCTARKWALKPKRSARERGGAPRRPD